LYSAICSCVLVVLVKLSVLTKWLAITPLMTPSWGEELHKAQVEECVCVYFSFVLIVYVAIYVSPWPYVLKVPLNSKQTNKPSKIQWNEVHHVTLQIFQRCLDSKTRIIGLPAYQADIFDDMFSRCDTNYKHERDR